MEGVEVGVGVEGFGAFGAFEPAYDGVGQWRGEDLVGDLEDVVEDDDVEDKAVGVDAAEGEVHEEDGVDGLADDCGADGAGPEVAAFGFDFEAGHHVGVGELAGKEGDEAGGEHSGEEVEDGDEGLLVVPAGVGWER